MRWLMIVMDFELFDTIGCVVVRHHSTNAYWDSEVNAIRFVDAELGFGVWNLYVDELDEKNFILWRYEGEYPDYD